VVPGHLEKTPLNKSKKQAKLETGGVLGWLEGSLSIKKKFENHSEESGAQLAQSFFQLRMHPNHG